MTRALFAAILAVLGCGTVYQPGGDAVAGDAGGSDAMLIDAPSALDGPPACTRGDANAVDPTTGACFELYRAVALPWSDARAACRALVGRDMAVVVSLDENATVAALIGALDVFAGGTDAGVEMQWVGMTGAPIVYAHWRAGEPNNGDGDFEEDCLVIEGTRMGQWDDRPCSPNPDAVVPGAYPYLCKR